MDDKLQRWVERINQTPDYDEYEDYLEMLAECRIIEEVAS